MLDPTTAKVRFGWQVAAPGLGWREQVGARRRRDRGVGRTRRRLVPTRGRDTEIIGTADDGSGFIYSVLDAVIDVALHV